MWVQGRGMEKLRYPHSRLLVVHSNQFSCVYSTGTYRYYCTIVQVLGKSTFNCLYVLVCCWYVRFLRNICSFKVYYYVSQVVIMPGTSWRKTSIFLMRLREQRNFIMTDWENNGWRTHCSNMKYETTMYITS